LRFNKVILRAEAALHLSIQKQAQAPAGFSYSLSCSYKWKLIVDANYNEAFGKVSRIDNRRLIFCKPGPGSLKQSSGSKAVAGYGYPESCTAIFNTAHHYFGTMQAKDFLGYGQAKAGPLLF